MYQISTQTQILGYTETPEFCYLLPSGSPQVVHLKEKDKATGIIYHGVIYNLPSHDDFEGAETATATECDAGSILNALTEKNDALEAKYTYTAMMTDTLIEEEEQEVETDV